MNTNMGDYVSQTLQSLREASFLTDPKSQVAFDKSFTENIKKYTQEDMIKILGGAVYMGEVTKGNFNLNGIQASGMYQKVKEIIERNTGNLYGSIIEEAEKTKANARDFTDYIKQNPGHIGLVFNEWINGNNNLSANAKDILTEIFKTNLYEVGKGDEIFVENKEKLDLREMTKNIFMSLNNKNTSNQIMPNEDQHIIREYLERLNPEDKQLVISGIIYMHDRINVKNTKPEQIAKNKKIEESLELICGAELDNIDRKILHLNREGNAIINMKDKIVDNKLHKNLEEYIDKNENLSLSEKAVLSSVAFQSIEEFKKNMFIVPDQNRLFNRIRETASQQKEIVPVHEKENFGR